MLQAVGGALLLPASLGLLLPEFPAEQRPLAIAAWVAVGGVAAAAGPPIGGLLVELDWRWVFLVNIPIGFGVLLVGRRILREHHEANPLRPDAIGAGALALGVGALVAAIVQGPDWGWGDARVIAGFAAAVALRGARRRGARRATPRRSSSPTMVRLRSFSVATTACLVYWPASARCSSPQCSRSTGPWGESALTAGLMIAPGPATAALTSVPGAKLAERLGFARAGLIGGAADSRGRGLVDHPPVGRSRLSSSDFLPGNGDRRQRRRRDAADLHRGGDLRARARALLDRRRGRHDGAAGRARARRRGGGRDHRLRRRKSHDFDGAWFFMAAMSLAAGGILLGLGRPAAAPATAEPIAVPA